VIEFVADEPGDWAHALPHDPPRDDPDGTRASPSIVGADTDEALDERMARSLPVGYMTMGTAGMGGMGEHGMPVPKNSAPMRGCAWALRLHRHGRHVHGREGAGEPDRAPIAAGWYAAPRGTVASARWIPSA
jgi:hypothetical protein